MAKRNLRIIKRVRGVPVLGICEHCNAQFSGDPNMGAQAAIQSQFNAHACKSPGVPPEPPKKATKKKPSRAV